MAETVVITKEFLEAIGAQKTDSVSVSKGAKGGYSWDIKIYSKDLMTEADAVNAKIEAIDAALRKKFGEQVQ